MLRGQQGIRIAGALLATLLLGACNAFDRGRLMPPLGGSGGTGGSDLDGGGGDPDAGPCVPSAEICNGSDDDCDGEPDNLDEDADAYCEEVVKNAEARCAPTGSGGALCVRLTCDPGFSSCDGIPSNGCETPGDECPCLTCEDAGQDDAGP